MRVHRQREALSSRTPERCANSLGHGSNLVGGPNVQRVASEEDESWVTGTRAYKTALRDPRIRRWLAEPYARRAVAGVVDARARDTRTVNDELERVMCPPHLRRDARQIVWDALDVRENVPTLALNRHVPQRATPAAPTKGTPYRSTYEMRLAAAFDRLGVRYTYETAVFDYQDHTGRWHTYRPDFVLRDLHMTFVEVKGPSGADIDARIKMRQVLRRHAMTLLLWDARVIDMVEDMQHASELMGLLRTTKLVA